MSEETFAFDRAGVETLTEMVRWWKERKTLSPRTLPADGPSPPGASVAVRVTSTSTTSGYYPGKIVVFDQSAKTYTDYGDVWVYEAEGAALTARHYLGRLAGVRSGVVVVLVDLAHTLLVRDDDTTVSISGTDTLSFAGAGCVVTQTATGHALVTIAGGGGSTSPASPNGSIQYDNSGTFGGSYGLTINAPYTGDPGAELAGVYYATSYSDSPTTQPEVVLTHYPRQGASTVSFGSSANCGRVLFRMYTGPTGLQTVAYIAAGSDSVASGSLTFLTQDGTGLLSPAYITLNTDSITLGGTHLALFDTVSPAAQQSHISDPSGGATQDAEARTAINSILDVLEIFGFMAP